MNYAYLRLPIPGNNPQAENHEPPRPEGRPTHDGYALQPLYGEENNDHERGVVVIEL